MVRDSWYGALSAWQRSVVMSTEEMKNQHSQKQAKWKKRFPNYIYFKNLKNKHMWFPNSPLVKLKKCSSLKSLYTFLFYKIDFLPYSVSTSYIMLWLTLLIYWLSYSVRPGYCCCATDLVALESTLCDNSSARQTIRIVKIRNDVLSGRWLL